MFKLTLSVKEIEAAVEGGGNSAQEGEGSTNSTEGEATSTGNTTDSETQDN